MPKPVIRLEPHDVVLIRCGLLRRMDNLQGRPECAASYERSRELLEMLFPFARDGKGGTLIQE